MTETDHIILGHLERHKGIDNAIAADQLARMVGLTTRNLRRRIRALIEHHGALIGSTRKQPSGYWIIVDPDELAIASASLMNLAVSLIKRAAVIRKVAVEEIFNQMRLV